MKILSIQEAEAALLPYVPLVAQLTGHHNTLERIEPLMELLGNPQDRLRIIHIAGTSGKTSTAYYLSSLLSAAGKKTGLTVSPHVDTITERVQINSQPLADKIFCRELGMFLDIIKQARQQPSYFELLYAFALWVFERQVVDYAVVETGMGGLHDATNVACRPDKVCVITDIGFDHTRLLGTTLPEITTQKVGIVHPGNPVFMYRQADEIMQVIQQWTSHQQAVVHIVAETTEEITTQTIPAYQRRNWSLAYRVYGYLKERDQLPNLNSETLYQTQQIIIPGRIDILQLDNKTLIMDGAHNAQKMAALLASFHELYPGARPAVLIALKEGKDYQEVVPLLTPLANRIITTAFNTSQDLPAVSMDPEVLAEAFREAGAGQVQSIADQHAAFQVLQEAHESIGLITGSFYLLSQLRSTENLIRRQSVPAPSPADGGGEFL